MGKLPSYMYYAMVIMASGTGYLILKDKISMSLTILWIIVTLIYIYKTVVEFVHYKRYFKE